MLSVKFKSEVMCASLTFLLTFIKSVPMYVCVWVSLPLITTCLMADGEVSNPEASGVFCPVANGVVSTGGLEASLILVTELAP